jgi:hypothetical protein
MTDRTWLKDGMEAGMNYGLTLVLKALLSVIEWAIDGLEVEAHTPDCRRGIDSLSDSLQTSHALARRLLQYIRYQREGSP